ncbi:MAG: M2 family metallopeptidase [Deltaproteobacteria bacterium]|nr:M2 family metallopeptidase [Deltaproteobacteria bacterium]
MRKELAETSTKLNSLYATGKVEYKGATLTLDDVSERLSASRDYDEQLALWEGWHAVAPPMKPLYTRFAELGNQGAKEMGVSDMGALWRSGYDMPPDEFVTEMDRLWGQVNPLYEQLHCAVRAELVEQYGPEKVSPTGPIPAHLLGNMWAQSWAGLYPEMIPYPDQPSLDVTASLVDQGYDAVRMVKLAEGFFTSLGLKPLPQTFWERSMLTRPEGKEVVCHASAWDLSFEGDVRIKMCTRPNMDDLITVHHELGHDYYYLYYYDKPVLFQQGAHDGFHEAIGDTLVLSVTPSYLKQVGLLSEVSDSPEAVINDQLLTALDRVAFLPFGLLMDRWRWGVFSGETSPDEYNASWWALRGQYQGIAPASPRGEEHFDPGAKYHIPAHTPYSRYFLSMILQFQFHKALCDASGYEGPLHQCSIYGSDEAGTRLATMLAMGSSKPWPDALEAMTGTRQMDAGPMLEYFTPLMGYLKEQNKDRQCGW